MPIARRVALAADLDRLDPDQRAALRGVRRFAQEHAHWRLAVDPFAAVRPAAGYDGVIALAYAGEAASGPPPGVPVVAVSHASWHLGTLSRVVPNLRTAGRLAAEHLLKCGFLRLGFLGYCPDLPTRLLREGFANKLRRAGISLASLLFNRHGLSRPSGWAAVTDAMARWLEAGAQPPVGAFASAAPLGRCLADLCLRRGLAVPEDVAILTPAADPDVVEFPPPALSTIDLGYEACGLRAAELLDELMGAAPAEPQRIVLEPGEIVPRRSTDVVTWRDPLVQRACRHIADHCSEPLRVADVAGALGVSLRELQRRFSEIHPLTVAGEVAHARLRRARRLLLGTDLTVEEVARRAGLSSGNCLARLLREAEGLSPTEYRRIRPPARRPDEPDLEKAKYLLATTRLPMDTVAYDSGYRRHRYLIDAFRREEGVTPRAWRKEHRRLPPLPAIGPAEVTFVGPAEEEESHAERAEGAEGAERRQPRMGTESTDGEG